MKVRNHEHALRRPPQRTLVIGKDLGSGKTEGHHVRACSPLHINRGDRKTAVGWPSVLIPQQIVISRLDLSTLKAHIPCSKT